MLISPHRRTLLKGHTGAVAFSSSARTVLERTNSGIQKGVVRIQVLNLFFIWEQMLERHFLGIRNPMEFQV